MKNILAFTFIFFVINNLQAQTANGCLVTGRYQSQIFSSTTKTTVKYGENINPGTGGQNEELFMDVHEPVGDALNNRPVIILAHGGSFQFGAKEDVESVCIDFAKRGYVAITMNYRKFPPGTTLDSVNAVEATIRAVQDMKAAVRFIKNDAISSNTFKTDTNFVLVGGFSAGAITAIQVAFWDVNDQVKPYINSIVTNEGGLEGQSNTITNVSSKVYGVLNSTGSIFDTTWIQSMEAPISSYHGTNDVVVPIGYGIAGGALYTFGSDPIHHRAANQNIPNYLQRVIGGGHSIYTGSYALAFQSYINSTATFFKNEILCSAVSSIKDENENKKIYVYPNPASTHFTISGIDVAVNGIQLFNDLGKEYKTQLNQQGDNLDVNIEQMKDGMYYLRVSDHEGQHTLKLIINNEN